MSFRFYDPILRIAKDLIAVETLDYFGLKYTQNMIRIENDNNINEKMMEILTCGKSAKKLDGPIAPVYKYPIVTRDQLIDHDQCIESIGIQNSCYLKIESEMKYLRAQYMRLKGDLFRGPHEDFKNIKEFKGMVDIRYCHEQEVFRRRYIFLKFKACYLYKMRLL